MLLTTLLLAHASAEWVEISQQHYRKPLRSYTPFATPYKAIDIDETSKPWVYNNQSVAEYNWNKHVVINAEEGTEDRYFGKTPVEDYGSKRPSGTIETVINGESAKGIVEKITNVGNVKRVQLNDSPVKSPNIKFKTDKDQNIYNIHPFDMEKEIQQQNMNEERTPLKNSTTARPILKGNNDYILGDDKVSSVNLNKYTNRELINTTGNSPKYGFANQDLDAKSNNNKKSHNTNDLKTVTTERDFYTAIKNVNEKNVEPSLTTLINEKKNQKNGLIPDLSGNENKNSKLNDRDRKNAGPIHEENKANITKSARTDTIEKLMKFMMIVADTMSKNSRRSFNGKVRYLEELKETILANIEDRIDATWPDEGGARRSSRSTQAHATARGHVEFPSSESSLMTISFLTFAVFLIKLVLQVIQTYKNKTMMVAPLMVAAAGRAAFAHRKNQS